MNIIYKITFQHRLAQNIQPYYYIGSKTSCTVVEGVILNSKGKHEQMAR